MNILPFYRNIFFTQDIQPLSVEASYSDTELVISATITVPNYNNEETAYERQWRVPFFQNLAKLNIGPEIDAYFNFPVDGVNTYTGNAATVNLVLEEKSRLDGSIKDTRTMTVEYIRGKSIRPELANRSKRLLHDGDPYFTERVYLNSDAFIFLSFLNYSNFTAGNAFAIFKNNIPVLSQLLNYPDKQLLNFGFNIPDWGIDFRPGDVISFRYNSSRKDVVVFPTPKVFTQLSYLNPYNLIETFHCGGDISFLYNNEIISFQSFKDLAFKTNNLSVDTTFELKVNTGWVTPHTANKIQDLIKSRWVNLETEGFQLPLAGKLVPKSFNQVAYDSDRGLEDYELSFVFNYENQEITNVDYPKGTLIEEVVAIDNDTKTGNLLVILSALVNFRLRITVGSHVVSFKLNGVTLNTGTNYILYDINDFEVNYSQNQVKLPYELIVPDGNTTINDITLMLVDIGITQLSNLLHIGHTYDSSIIPCTPPTLIGVEYNGNIVSYLFNEPPNGDSYVTIALQYSTDGGATWTEVGHTDYSGQNFTVQIVGVATGTPIKYRLKVYGGCTDDFVGIISNEISGTFNGVLEPYEFLAQVIDNDFNPKNINPPQGGASTICSVGNGLSKTVYANVSTPSAGAQIRDANGNVIANKYFYFPSHPPTIWVSDANGYIVPTVLTCP